MRVTAHVKITGDNNTFWTYPSVYQDGILRIAETKLYAGFYVQTSVEEAADALYEALTQNRANIVARMNNYDPNSYASLTETINGGTVSEAFAEVRALA